MPLKAPLFLKLIAKQHLTSSWPASPPAACLQRALTNPPCVLIILTWGIRQLEKCLFFVFCQTAHSVLSCMSLGEMFECGKAPGTSMKGPKRIKSPSLWGLNMSYGCTSLSLILILVHQKRTGLTSGIVKKLKHSEVLFFIP